MLYHKPGLINQRKQSISHLPEILCYSLHEKKGLGLLRLIGLGECNDCMGEDHQE